MSGAAVLILSAATAAPTTGEAHEPRRDQRTFQAIVETSSGDGTATIEMYGSDVPPTAGVGNNGVLLGTIGLSGASGTADGFASVTPWRHVWAKLTAISGADASVDVWMGV
ncbi:MAG TPA: hypothetical protein VJZ25_07030 [Gemmatimonadaceae bacterium]|nr:hypothetical protein [Gemmatimonadaceae bacterium]